MKGINNKVLCHHHHETVSIPYGEGTVQRVVAVRRIRPGYFSGIMTKRGHITGKIFWYARKHPLPVFFNERGQKVDHGPLLAAIRQVCLNMGQA